MRHTRSVSAVLFAAFMFSFAVTADAAMMRATWAGTIVDAVSGNPYALATGQAYTAIGSVDEAALSALISGAEAAPVNVNVSLRISAPLVQAYLIHTELRFTGANTWVALDAAGVEFASGSWSPDRIEFSRVVPIPAALPLLLGAIGVLGGMRRRK